MMELKERFGQYIRYLRLIKGLKQQELCKQANIKTTYLSKIENGKVDPPSEEILLRLAVALDENPNLMIIKAGKIPTEFQKIIMENHEVFHYLESYLEVKKGC